MVALLPILLLALLDVEPSADRQRVKHELQNRLGLREEAAPSDLRARLRWVQRNYPKDPWVWQAVLMALHSLWTDDDEAIGHYVATDLMDQFSRDEPFQTWSDGAIQNLLGPTWTGPFEQATEAMDAKRALYERLLPPAGLRSNRETIVPWLAAQASEIGPDDSVGYENARNLFESDVTPGSLQMVLDWLESDAALGRRLQDLSWHDALQWAGDWHRELEAEAAERRRLGIAEPPPAGVVVATFPNGDRIERLETKDALDGEGRYLGHCVGGESRYWPNIRDGRGLILSYRDEKGRPRATVEILIEHAQYGGSSKVLQVQGPGNAPIDDPEVSSQLAAFLFAFFLDVRPETYRRVNMFRFDAESAWRHLGVPLFLDKGDWDYLENNEIWLQEKLDEEEAELESKGDRADVLGHSELCREFYSNLKERVKHQIEETAHFTRVLGDFEIAYLTSYLPAEKGFGVCTLPRTTFHGGVRFQIWHIPNGNEIPSRERVPDRAVPGLLKLLAREGILMKEKDFLARYRKVGEAITFTVPKEDVLLPHATFLERRGLALKKGRLVTR